MSSKEECGLMRDIKKEFAGFVLETSYNIIFDERKGVAVPEKESPMAVYEIEETLDIPFPDRKKADLVLDIFKPVVPVVQADQSDPAVQELPAIVALHGGGLIEEERDASRDYTRALASRGYVVFNLEYRHAPKANVYEQLDDIYEGLDMVGQRLEEFNVDPARIFLTAVSEGAFLAVLVAAMQKSKALQEAAGHEPASMTFQALGLHGGMYYINKDDPIGFIHGDQLFGKKEVDDSFRKYLDLEHREIIKNIPPIFHTTSKGDWLNNYALMYHEALKKAGRKSHLLYMGDAKLGHACVGADPNLAACVDAIDKMCVWFDEQIEQSRRDQERAEREQKAYQEIRARLEDGELIGCKSWRFIKELNSFSMVLRMK